MKQIDNKPEFSTWQLVVKFKRWILNFSCSNWSRWTIVTAPGDYRMSLEIVLQKEVSEGNWKHFVSYSRSCLLSESSFWWMIFNKIAELFFKMATLCQRKYNGGFVIETCKFILSKVQCCKVVRCPLDEPVEAGTVDPKIKIQRLVTILGFQETSNIGSCLKMLLKYRK